MVPKLLYKYPLKSIFENGFFRIMVFKFGRKNASGRFMVPKFLYKSALPNFSENRSIYDVKSGYDVVYI